MAAKGKKAAGSFSSRHGTQHPTMSKTSPKPVSEKQLGHEQQLPVNPPTPMGSPLLNPGEPGHPMAAPGSNSLAASMNYPSGEDFY